MFLAAFLFVLAQVSESEQSVGRSAISPSTALKPSPPSAPRWIPAGTEVQIELAESVSSATNHVGDKFALRLAEPILLQGESMVPAGASGNGEVIDAGHAGMGGRQGKLIVSARYLELYGRKVRIRGMTFQVSGKSHVDLATGVLLLPYVGIASTLIEGGEITIPEGTRATAKLAEDVELPLSPSTETGKP